jgi:hypothetical protein
MENFEIQENYNSLDLGFLQKRISHLRQQKGRYISTAFIKNIEHVHHALSLAISNNSKSASRVIDTKPEKISDSMVDCCLYYMGEILQKLIATQQQQEKSQIIHQLENLDQDLYSLSICIRYSIDSHALKKF